MSLEAKRISILKTEIEAGLFLLTISDLKMHKKSNGDLILHEDNPAVIVSFKNDNKIHQELYWIGSSNYTKLQRIILQVGLDPNKQISKKEIVGKQIMGLIKEIKTMRGSQEIGSKMVLSDTYPIDSVLPAYYETIQYNQEGF